jgi:hypothetical protein
LVNWKAAAVLAAVLVALGVYALGSRPHPAAPPRTASLLPCDIIQTVDIRIAEPGRRVVEARRVSAGQEWLLVQPSPGPADGATVDGVLTAASQLEASDTLKSVPNGSDLGLDPPHLSVSCTLARGASYTLSIGGQNFDGSGDYARLSGDSRVLVIPAATVAKFQGILDQPPVRPSPSPSGSVSPSPSPSP